MSGRRRLISCTLVTVLILVGFPSGTAVAGPHALPCCPIVLVHGLTGGGPEVWGDREAGARGLYGRLVTAGYSPGKTLFAYDYPDTPNADYAALAEVGLGRVIGRALALSGANSVDIIAFGSGALIARYWAATYRGAAAPLRNLIMIAPPNHGQFQAALLKVFHHTDRLVHGGARVDGVARAGQVAFPGGAGFPEPPAFTSEDEYVDVRAFDYAGLYAEYVLTARLLGSGSPQGASGGSTPPPDYEPWLAATHRDLVEGFVYAVELPSGPRGLGLTLAYYEILSLRVGRQVHLARTVTVKALPALPSIGRIIDDGWKSALLGYFKKLLLDWGVARARDLWNRERAGVAVSLGEVLSGFSPGSPAMSRLIPEHLSFPDGGPMTRRVLCNWFLNDWQEREASGRAPGSRYVTIAGSCPNLLGLAGLGAGANDLVVEVGSTLIDPQPADIFLLREGLWAFHRALATSAAVVSSVLGVLLNREAPWADEGGGSGAAGPWAPSYKVLAVGGDPETTTGDLTVEVTLADPAAAGFAGLSAVVWSALAKTGPDGQLIPGQAPTPTGFFQLESPGVEGDPHRPPVLQGLAFTPAPGPGEILVLGVRLVPDAAGAPGYIVLGHYLGRDTRIPFGYSVSRRPAAVALSAAPVTSRPTTPVTPTAAPPATVPVAPPVVAQAPPYAGSAPGGGPDVADAPLPVEDLTAEPGGEPGQDPTGASGSSSEYTAGRAEIVASPEPPPLVSVIRVTKMTTTKHESRVLHARWEWDFGDGEQHTDHDPSHTLVDIVHTYMVAGTYAARAVSWANDGRLLRELTWNVEVEAGQAVAFEAETIVEPIVDIVLSGPQKWVTGRPARFQVTVEVSWPPRTRRQVLRAYPGWLFDVVWEKPGAFEVRAAVNVRQSYEFPERRLTVSNTYIMIVPIEIFTPGLTE